MASPSTSATTDNPLTVSELIEVWQDWALILQQKKRTRRWSLDETLQYEEEDDANHSGKRKKSRHSDQMIRPCSSFPEESFLDLECSYMRDSASVRHAHNESLNITSLSIGDQLNESILHIGCIDSNGNPIDMTTDNEEMVDASIDNSMKCAEGRNQSIQYDSFVDLMAGRLAELDGPSMNELKDFIAIDDSFTTACMETEEADEESEDFMAADNREISVESRFMDCKTDKTTLDEVSTNKAEDHHQDTEINNISDSETKAEQEQSDGDEMPKLNKNPPLELEHTSHVKPIHQAEEMININKDISKEMSHILDHDDVGEHEEVIPQHRNLGAHEAIPYDELESYENANSNVRNSVEKLSMDVEAIGFKERDLPSVTFANAPDHGDENVDPQSNGIDQQPLTLGTSRGKGIIHQLDKSIGVTLSDESRKGESEVNGNVEERPNADNTKQSKDNLSLSSTFADTQRSKDKNVDRSQSLDNGQQHIDPLDSNKNSSQNTNGRQQRNQRNPSMQSRIRKRRCHLAIVEQDASFAFSPYCPVPQVMTNISHVSDKATNIMHPETDSQTVSAAASVDTLIENPKDSVMEQYLENMSTVKDFYTSTQPFRMGKRNLPLNQVEVVLRRRAIKKRDTIQTAVMRSNMSVDEGLSHNSNTSDNSNTVITGRKSKTALQHPHMIKPHSRESYSGSRNHSVGMDTFLEDDSTVSSATIASTLTTGNASISTPVDYTSMVKCNRSMPQEEIVGDVSLGLKLTILHGKVIVQAISSLEDGRASPAQLCGLFHPGDVLIAVNESSLINGNIHTPVPMDKMVSALKPLSEPIDGDGQYSREVKLRFVFGEGKKLLREQKEREQRKQRFVEERKKMGLDDKAGARSIDHAADIFGLSALMGVDQHSGMPLFQQHHLETHHDEKVKEDPQASKDDDEALTVEATANIQTSGASCLRPNRPSYFTKDPPLLQSRISDQVGKELTWMRNHNASKYYTLDSHASLLVRAQSFSATELPAKHEFSQLNPAEARTKKLELGASNITYAKELISSIETQDRGSDIHADEDPMEVASRICGSASVRTGASKRRWHHSGSVVLGDTKSFAVSKSSIDNQGDANTIYSGESAEACDHRLLVDLAANNQSWKHNVVRRLKEYATSTVNTDGYDNINSQHEMHPENEIPTSLDSLLFGSDVTKILAKNKSSSALPPCEITQMLFDLKEHLQGGLPMHVFTGSDAFTLNEQDKPFSFMESQGENNADVSKAAYFLVNDALSIWLKSFCPLPWKQRRALWPLHLSGFNSELGSMVSSNFDDGSLSMASGGTYSTTIATERRKLREIIEELELDPETRRETCCLVTFYFTFKYLRSDNSQLSQEDEKSALVLIDTYGSYLDIHKALVLAGKLQSRPIIDKLLSVAKFDPQHGEALKGLQRAKTLLFYEPNMLSALYELLQTGAYNSISSNFDIIRLLVSAYPDLSPMSVRAASDSPEDFYFKYLSLLMHPDEGSDAAKRDKGLVKASKEWCSMLCSFVESNDDKSEESVHSFYHVASTSDNFSSLYHRDLPFLLDISTRMSEYNLALDIAREMLLSPNKTQGHFILEDTISYVRHISEIAIAFKVDASLLGQVIDFYNEVSKKKDEFDSFDIVTELKNIFQQCTAEGEQNESYDRSSNINACLAAISQTASPLHGIKVLCEFELPLIDFQSKTAAINTMLTRGARESVGQEISGSLLRIQRVREERWRIGLEEMVYNFDQNEATVDEQESEGFIWPSILDGRMSISKSSTGELRIENRLLEQYLKEKRVNFNFESLDQNENTTSIIAPVEAKLQLVTDSLSKINNLIENRKVAANKLISTIKIMLTEVDLCIRDLQRDADNFKRDVVDSEKCIYNPDQYQAEKLVKYFKGKIYDQESALDRLRLLNKTFLNKKRRLKSHINQKEDTSIQFIKYHEMQQKQKENKKLLIDKSAAIALRKIAAEKAKQSILSFQSELQVLESKSTSNVKKLELREKHSVRLDEMIQIKQNEFEIQKNILKGKESKGLQQVQNGGPDIMQYILRKAEIFELQASIKSMERKIDIAKGNLKNPRCREIQAKNSL